MSLYAESSAVLAWLLDEPDAGRVRRLLATSETVLASDLTIVECDRVLHRAAALGELSEADAAARRGHLTAASAQWNVLRIAPEIVERARQPFPGEPVRTLAALHLATALVARASVTGLELLTLDERIRRTAGRLGLTVVPA